MCVYMYISFHYALRARTHTDTHTTTNNYCGSGYLTSIASTSLAHAKIIDKRCLTPLAARTQMSKHFDVHRASARVHTDHRLNQSKVHYPYRRVQSLSPSWPDARRSAGAGRERRRRAQGADKCQHTARRRMGSYPSNKHDTTHNSNARLANSASVSTRSTL